MDFALVLDNLLSPPILFFFLGAGATLLRSDLEVPASIGRFLSLYLLIAIGLHGGHELSQSELGASIVIVLLVAMATSLLVPVWSFAFLRLRLDVPNAAAIAATYGSISAVTFITAVNFLTTIEVQFGGHMVAAMALMESPAIVSGVLLARMFGATNGERSDWRELGREAFLNGAVLLLLGSLLIGFLTGDKGWAAVRPLVYDPFKGVLCFFLLEMGLVAARRLPDLRASGTFLVGFGIIAAVVHGLLGVGLGWLLAMPPGDALLLAMLVGSASYIAVPAAVRLAIPDANPSLYVPMSLGVTFPFNIIIGIPLYYSLIQLLWSTP